MNDASVNKKINEIQVSNDLIYKKKLLKTIESCYRKAPYYEFVKPLIESIIFNEEKNLALFIEFSIRIICDYLQINTQLILSSSIVKRNYLKGQNKIIEICKLLGASEYYNAIGGLDLYSVVDFQNEGIKLKFIQTEITPYKQFNNEFIPNLSIIDVLMFNSIKEVNEMLDKYVLK
jgi:hypothetical protein